MGLGRRRNGSAKRGLGGLPREHSVAFDDAAQGAVSTGADAVALIAAGRCEDAVHPLLTHVLRQGAAEAHFVSMGADASAQKRHDMEGLRAIRRRAVEEFSSRCVKIGTQSRTMLAPVEREGGEIEF